MTCKDCIHYDMCSGVTPTDLDSDVFDYCREGRTDEIPDIEERCSSFKDRNRFIELPCKVEQMVYKICPKCNEGHSGSCKNCAWRGCLGYGCDIGVRVYSDGSFNKHELQIVPSRVTAHNIITIFKLWNIMYFATEEEANTAKEEYDAIRKIEDRKKRYRTYKAWQTKREKHYAFLEEDE